MIVHWTLKLRRCGLIKERTKDFCMKSTMQRPRSHPHKRHKIYVWFCTKMLSLLNEVVVPKNKERCGKISMVHLLSSNKLFVIQKKIWPCQSNQSSRHSYCNQGRKIWGTEGQYFPSPYPTQYLVMVHKMTLFYCSHLLDFQTFRRLYKWKKNEPNEDNYISSGRGDFWPPKNHLEITRELLLTSNWGSSSNLWFAPNQAYLVYNVLKSFLIEHYCNSTFFQLIHTLNYLINELGYISLILVSWKIRLLIQRR